MTSGDGPSKRLWYKSCSLQWIPIAVSPGYSEKRTPVAAPWCLPTWFSATRRRRLRAPPSYEHRFFRRSISYEHRFGLKLFGSRSLTHLAPLSISHTWHLSHTRRPRWWRSSSPTTASTSAARPSTSTTRRATRHARCAPRSPPHASLFISRSPPPPLSHTHSLTHSHALSPHQDFAGTCKRHRGLIREEAGSSVRLDALASSLPSEYVGIFDTRSHTLNPQV